MTSRAARIAGPGLLEQALRGSDVASDGREGALSPLDCRYDAIILDIMLPALDGSRCASICGAGSSVPSDADRVTASALIARPRQRLG